VESELPACNESVRGGDGAREPVASDKNLAIGNAGEAIGQSARDALVLAHAKEGESI